MKDGAVAAVPGPAGPSDALRRALAEETRPVVFVDAAGSRPLDTTAFMAPRHARSHAIFTALTALGEKRPLARVVFDEPEDAFTTATARALTGSLAELELAVVEKPARAGSALVTREELLEGAFRDGARRYLDGAGPATPLPERGPLVSVIVPHYNLGRLLPETLASIAGQRYRDFEIVLVDDGSTDPASVLAFERASAPNLRKVKKANGGLASARNAGLAVAKGEYVLPLDADDLIASDYIAAGVRAHRRVPDLAFVTSYAEYFRVTPGDIPGFGYVPIGLHPPTSFLGNYASTCSALIKRSALEEVGGYDESWPSYEDWDVWCSMAERGMRAGVLPQIGFHYRFRDQSMVRTTAKTNDRALRARLVAKHQALAREHARDALIAHLAVAPCPDARPPKPSRFERLRERFESAAMRLVRGGS